MISLLSSSAFARLPSRNRLKADLGGPQGLKRWDGTGGDGWARREARNGVVEGGAGQFASGKVLLAQQS
jgi:hypothetical protein